LSAEQSKNAFSSTCLSLDSVSNVTADSDVQELKQDLQRISTEAGMQIDSSDEHWKKASFPIR
jgi:hypothetical protein